MYLPNCVVMAPVVVQNGSGEDVWVMVFGKVEDGELKRIGSAPLGQIKGIEITDGVEREEM